MEPLKNIARLKKTIILFSFFSIVGLGLLFYASHDSKNSNTEEVMLGSLERVVPYGPVLNESNPVRLEIPKLSIDTAFTSPLGLDDTTGEVVIPDDYEKVGWYKYGPTPGEYGPSVILGHVDSYTGPAIFFYLGQLSEGDDIFITREDGSKARFEVTLLERYEQSNFPTEKVYGNIDHAGLRLVTCSGTYDRGKKRYTHNLVVYAKLVE